MNTKELTHNTLDNIIEAIEEELNKDDLLLYNNMRYTLEHKIQEILQDHNTAYEQMIVTMLKQYINEYLTIHGEFVAYRQQVLNTMLDKVFSR